jgi:ABC-type nitrate/sulfonate/bicarbonate transport system permease component
MGDGWLDRLVNRIVFPAPREMTQADIDAVTARFVDTARLMADTGFAGVQLHGAHGYLIGTVVSLCLSVASYANASADQFLNPKVDPPEGRKGREDS